MGAEPSVQHQTGLSRVVSTTEGNVKSLRESKFFPIVWYSIGHNGEIKCGFRHIYFAGLRSAVAGQLIICALSVIQSAKGTLRRVTGQDFFPKRVLLFLHDIPVKCSQVRWVGLSPKTNSEDLERMRQDERTPAELTYGLVSLDSTGVIYVYRMPHSIAL